MSPIYERYNGTSWTKVEEHPKQNGVEQSGYALTSFAIGFEDTTSTYTYELLIPYDETHILKYHDLVLSFAVRDAYVSTVNSTNAYNISDVCRATTYQGYGSNDAAAVYGDERTLPFYRLNPLRIRINDDRYVKDHAAEMPNTAPTINGEVSVTEWGNPVVVTNSEYANDMWDSGHVLSDKANYNPKQRAKVWLTNDNDFIYVAATLDHEDPGDSWTPTDRNHPRFVILLSQKGAGNGPVLVEGKDQYTRLGIGFKDDATATLNDKTYANIASALMDSSKLSRAAKFEQGTYTYELKIPFAMTNIEFKDSTEIAVSILICGANHDGVNNRYNIGGTGCSKSNTNSTNAQDQCLIMTLNDVQNPEAAIDGINYPTLEAALDAATSGQTVTLLDNVTADEIMVNNGVTLDLAGHALTASTVIANVGVGQIVDSSIGEGIIKITKNSEDVANLLLTKDHGTLPLYEAQDGGYRFFTPTFESQERESGDTNKRIFGIRVGLPSEKAYDLLDDTDNYKVLSIKLVLTKDGDTQPTTIDHAFKQTTVEEYVSESLKDLNKKKGIMLTVTGLDVAAEAGITVTATASMAVANETVEKAY